MRSVDEEVEDVIGRLKAAVGVSLFDASAARGGPSLFDRVYDADVPRGTVDDDWDPVRARGDATRTTSPATKADDDANASAIDLDAVFRSGRTTRFAASSPTRTRPRRSPLI